MIPFSGRKIIPKILILTGAAILVFIAGSAAKFQAVGAQGVEKEPAAVAEKKAAPETGPQEESWPRVLEGKAVTLIAHQPQLDKWDFNVIECRMAVEITPKGKRAPLLRRHLAQGKHRYQCGRPPGAGPGHQGIENPDHGPKPEEIRELEKNINETFLGRTLVISLDRLIAAAAATPEIVRVRSIKAEMAPPAILVSQSPALLLLINGDPALQPVGKTGLSVVVNSNLDLFFYESEKTYYLFTGEQWLSARDLKGNWEGNIRPPQVFEAIPKDHPKAYLKEVLGTKSGKTVAVLRADPPRS